METEGRVGVVGGPADFAGWRSRALEHPLGRAMASVASMGWSLGSGARGWAYRLGWLSVESVGVPVVSVGGLLAGGTGKTPLVGEVARWFARQPGTKVAVVSRGYGGNWRGPGPLLVSDGRRVLADASVAGDEPVMLARELGNRARVVVGRRRVLAARYARERLGANLVVLDDGFQHRALARDIDLLIVPDEGAAGRGELAPIPRGLLRESLWAASRADLKVRLLPIAGSPRSRTAESGPVTPDACFRLEANALEPLARWRDFGVATDGPRSEEESVAWLRGRPVGVLATIARPERFLADLRSHGAQVVAQCLGADHQRFAPDRVQDFLETTKARGGVCVVTTGKDAVKLPRLAGDVRILTRRVVWEDGGVAVDRIFGELLRALPAAEET